MVTMNNTSMIFVERPAGTEGESPAESPAGTEGERPAERPAGTEGERLAGTERHGERPLGLRDLVRDRLRLRDRLR